MLSLLRLRVLRSRATRIPEIPPCRRRDADFSDALHHPKDAPALVSRRGGAVAVRRGCGANEVQLVGNSIITILWLAMYDPMPKARNPAAF
jgi:hypothetical protein